MVSEYFYPVLGTSRLKAIRAGETLGLCTQAEANRRILRL